MALAFKTDKLTLEKRLEIQERSRDVAEQNIENELQGIKDSVMVSGDHADNLCTCNWYSIHSCTVLTN